MRQVTLGSTGITVPQNGFGALPIQRVTKDEAVQLLQHAYAGGIHYFDTARAYSDSEEKLGAAFHDLWDKVFLATKTHAKTPAEFWQHLETSLRLLQTDCIDVYQFHCVEQCWRPGDGSGMYEAMLEARQQGKIRHIGATAHKIEVAFECVESGLYETMQFPFSYLAGEQELALVEGCRAHGMGFIAMKGMAGGLLRDGLTAAAWMAVQENVVPIWGVQRERELDEFLSYIDNPPRMTDDIRAVIEGDRAELCGEFCRGCGYCMPCPAGIEINNCARMSLLLRRSPSAEHLSPAGQAKMKKIEGCLHCNRCKAKCPYGLDTPALLARNYEDYKRVLAGEVKVQ